MCVCVCVCVCVYGWGGGGGGVLINDLILEGLKTLFVTKSF